MARFLALLALCVAPPLLTGCAPVWSKHPVADPQDVTEVVAWETPIGTDGPGPRHAVVTGRAAAELVECLTYARQDNPFVHLEGVVGVKADGRSLLIRRRSGPPLKVTLAYEFFYWDGPQSRVGPLFEDRYARLPWQPGPVSAATTRP